MNRPRWYVIGALLAALLGGMSAPALAVTVYFTDGTTLEVDNVTRVGNTAYLILDLSRIDLSRTDVKELDALGSAQPPIQQEGLSLLNFNIVPSDDLEQLTIVGDVFNNTRETVRDVRVVVTLKNKQDRNLMTAQTDIRPATLAAGETGHFELHVNKPTGFAKASAEVQGVFSNNR